MNLQSHIEGNGSFVVVFCDVSNPVTSASAASSRTWCLRRPPYDWCIYGCAYVEIWCCALSCFRNVGRGVDGTEVNFSTFDP